MRSAALKSVTIRDVAREANVSVASASRALNGMSNVTDSTRERVLGAAASLRYVPHLGARSLITRRTDTVGVVLPDLHGEFFSEVLRGVDAGARALGLHLLVSNSLNDPAEAARAIRAMRGRADGLLVMSPNVDGAVLAGSLEDGLPVVLMNTRAPDARHPSFQVDNYGGAYAVVRHLIERGRTRVAHIAGPESNFEALERRRGYLEALREHAPGVEPQILLGEFTEDSGHEAGARLAEQERRPDAVFAANDMMAVGCLLALQEAGVRTPEDVAVAGFDDVPLARMIRPSLTTVRVNISDLGRRALERLATVIAHPDSEPSAEIVRPELVVRDSSGPALRRLKNHRGKNSADVQ